MDSWEDDDDAGEDELKDFSFGGKDAVLFLVDATQPMRVKLEDATEEGEPDSALQMALRAAEATLKTKVFAAPNDLVGVLLFGTRKKVGVRDFEHLSVLLPLDTPEAAAVLRLEEVGRDLGGGGADGGHEGFDDEFGSAEQGRASLQEALWQCQAMFADVQGKVGKKSVVVMTCVDDPHADDADQRRKAMQKAADLHDTGIQLDVLPVGNKSFDMEAFYRDLMQLAQDEPFRAADASERYEDLLTLVRKRVHKKRSVGRMHFEFGKGVKIAVSTYNFVQKAYKPTKVKLAKDTNEEVRVQRTFVNHSTGAPLLPSDMNKFQEYGGKRIKFTMDEVKSLTTMDGKLGLRLCGFRPLSDLKWSHFVRPGSFIYPEERMIKGSRNLFAALLIKCLEKKLMAVCAYKPRDISSPSFVALVPQEETRDGGRQLRPAGFSIVFLPFCDDLRSVPEVRLAEPDPEQVAAAKKMIMKLRMKDYQPEAFENPDLQCHYNLIESLALKRDDVESPEDTSMPDPDMQAKLLKGADRAFVDSVYPEGYNPDAPASKSKRKPAAAAKREAPASKKPKQEINQDTLDMGAYVKDKRVDKLTVVQLKDYLKSIDVNTGNKKKADLVQAVYEYFN